MREMKEILLGSAWEAVAAIPRLLPLLSPSHCSIMNHVVELEAGRQAPSLLSNEAPTDKHADNSTSTKPDAVVSVVWKWKVLQLFALL